MKILLSFLLFCFTFSAESKTCIYSYIDGSGNKYELIGDSLHYTPVKKENSSSGEYSGGVAKTVKVTAEESASLKSMFEKAIKTEDQQQENREMGTGLVVRQKGKKETSVILKMSAAAKIDLEQTLKKVLSK